MREHPDDFLPFFVSEINDDAMMSPQEYESYCATVEKTAEWGGEPEVSLSVSVSRSVPVLTLAMNRFERCPSTSMHPFTCYKLALT